MDLDAAIAKLADRAQRDPAFTGPLEFGNAKQIAVLRQFRRDVEALERRAERGVDVRLSVYDVEYEVRRTAVVVATSEDEAVALLEEELGADGSVCGVRRMRPADPDADDAGVIALG
jgi:phosphatidylserine/phosphatidylglycerophosphate/cardiolipin synthase-like enzyme